MYSFPFAMTGCAQAGELLRSGCSNRPRSMNRSFEGSINSSGPFFVTQVEATVGESKRTLGRVSVSPENITRLKVQTSKHAPAISTIGAVQLPVHDNHATMMVLHARRKEDLFARNFTIGRLHELHGPPAGAIGRSRKHLSILMNRRCAIDTHRVGRSVDTATKAGRRKRPRQ